MQQVIIGVDPHKLSATIEVVDQDEKFLGSGRFTTDQAGYAAMRKYAMNRPGFRRGSLTWNLPRSGRVAQGSSAG